ncbi:SGNH/GDSL hydrolase family protein [Algoriphagus sp.]|uniref:SGNH/GDSL hydrolase family protein n=1 Tax=Algoriphagus sp. TaxID=1872435 RepID=UPI00329495A3
MKIFYLPVLILGMLACNSSKNMLPDDSTSTMTKNTTGTSDQLTYLALGDSYTIGEGVSEEGRYPSQLVTKLNAETTNTWAAPKVIARTGWTVDELEQGINKEEIDGKTYDLVTLLIGVNNQYRGRSVTDFEKEFEAMLKRAISFAGNDTNHVVVISIPDWGVTPFAQAQNRDASKVAKEINAYNRACKTISENHDVTYIDITEQYRKSGAELEMLAADGLHPSAKMYTLWTDKLVKHIEPVFK